MRSRVSRPQPPNTSIQNKNATHSKTTNSTITLEKHNAERERTLSSMMAWGAAFGFGVYASQKISYIIASAASVYVFFEDIPGNTFAQQMDYINFIPSSIASAAVGNILSNLTYLTTFSAAFAILNIFYQHLMLSKNPSESFEEPDFLSREQPRDINLLYKRVVVERRLKTSKQQVAAMTILAALFIVPNFIYDFAYKDVGEAAIELLPNYGSDFFKAINQYAGIIAFTMNLFLNQWFEFEDISKTAFYNFDLLQLTRTTFHKDGKASYGNVIGSIFLMLLASTIGALGFFYLAVDDPQLAEKSKAMQFLIPASAFIIYGAVLNTVGSIGIVNDLKKQWAWLCTIPKPLLEGTSSLSKYQGNILGYFAWNIKEYFREIAYYLGYSAYASNHDLNLPSSQSPYLPLTTNSNQPENSEYISLAELEERVSIRIAQLTDAELAQKNDSLLSRLITEERTYLKSKKQQSLRKADVWKNGRVRSTFKVPFALIGPVGMSVALIGYYLLVEAKISEKFGLDPVRAGNLQISFYLFFPFLMMIYKASYASMEKKFCGIEKTASQFYHTYEVMRGDKKSADFHYSERFHPLLNKKEICQFTIGSIGFLLQIAAVLFTGPSAGTAIYLLNKYNFYNAFTQHVSYWSTALFNSIGFSSFIHKGESVYAELQSKKGTWDLFRQKDEFFRAVEDSPSTRFDIDQLEVYRTASIA